MLGPGALMDESAATRESARLRRFYDRSAAGYDRWMRVYDRFVLGHGRRRICALARGQTLDLAIGTGRNLAFYPPDVVLTGIDLSPGMLAVAEKRARELGRAVELRLGDAVSLDFPDGHFDTVVATLLLSSVPNERRAATEARRVLGPGGQLLVLDHVRSPVAPVRWAERLLDPLMTRLTGDHLLRDPLDYLEAAGFRIRFRDRSRMGVVEEVVADKGS
jgi:ubiquinone/menaquinone biosynthesis C-methylase UbiE